MTKTLLLLLVAISGCALDGGATNHNADQVNAASRQITFNDGHVARTARPGAVDQPCDPGCDCTFAPAADYWDVDGSESSIGYTEKCPSTNLELDCLPIVFSNTDQTTASCLEYPIGQDPVGNASTVATFNRE